MAPLNHVEVEGSTDVPHVLVKTSSHEIKLQHQFHAVANAENGDVFLQDVQYTTSVRVLFGLGPREV